MRTGWAAEALCLALFACKGSELAQPTLTVEVLGSLSAFASADVQVLPLSSDRKLRFRSRFLYETFLGNPPLGADAPVVTLRSHPSSSMPTELFWVPFICGQDPMFSQKMRAGWEPRETLQVAVHDDGVLSLESEFDQPLSHTCEWSGPQGSGEGSSSFFYSKTLCTEPDRSNTDATFLEVSDPNVTAFIPTLCRAYHWKPRTPDTEFAGIIENELVSERDDGTVIGLNLKHCWREGEVYPLIISGAVPPDSGCGAITLSLSKSDAVVELVGSDGQWVLHNGPELAAGGHQVSDFDLTFGEPGERRFRVKGHFEVPITKVRFLSFR